MPFEGDSARTLRHGYLQAQWRAQEHREEHWKITSGEFKDLIVVVLVAYAVRLFRLGELNSVVFDEVYFGKFTVK